MNGAQACGIQSAACVFDGGSPWQIFRARLRERRRTGAKAAVRVIRIECSTPRERGRGSAPKSVDGAASRAGESAGRKTVRRELVRAENAKQSATWDEAGVGIGPGNPASSHARQPGQRPHRLRALHQNHRPRRPPRPPRCLSARISPCPVCSSTQSPLRPRPSVYVTASPNAGTAPYVFLLQFVRTWSTSLGLWGAGAGVTALYVRPSPILRSTSYLTARLGHVLASVCHPPGQARISDQGARGTSHAPATRVDCAPPMLMISPVDFPCSSAATSRTRSRSATSPSRHVQYFIVFADSDNEISGVRSDIAGHK